MEDLIAESHATTPDLNAGLMDVSPSGTNSKQHPSRTHATLEWGRRLDFDAVEPT